MYPFSGVILKLANEALKADMKRAAIMLYQLVPSTEPAIDHSKDIVKGIGKLPTVRSSISGATYDREQMEEARRSPPDRDGQQQVGGNRPAHRPRLPAREGR